MNDIVARATALDGKVRLFAARTTKLVEEIRRRHDLLPTAAAAVGRTATAAAIMGAMLKGDEKLTVQVKGGGPIGQIVADANANGDVRAYAENPHADLPLNSAGKMDVAGVVGTEGFLYVVKDLGMREPYRGSVPIVSGEIAEDFTYYFAKSEQIPSAVSLGVLVDTDYSIKAAGGLVLQLLPGVPEDAVDELERRLYSVPPVTAMLERGLTPEEMMRELADDISVVSESTLRFQCFCSRERVEQTLAALGKDEIDAMIEEMGEAEVVCHFCNEKYVFAKRELQTLRDRLNDA